MKIDHYTYRIAWSLADKEYVGLCEEFPSLSWLEKTQEAALAGIRQAVADVVKEMRSASEAIPAPISVKRY